MSNKTLTIGLLITLVIAVIGLFFGNTNPQKMSVGIANEYVTRLNALQTTMGIYDSGSSEFTGTLKLGSSGTAVSAMIKGTCTLVSDSSIAATSTGTGTCAATGTVAGDQVFVSLATTTTKMAAQYAIVGAVAGTNTVTVRLLNQTGTAAVPSATNGFGSSTQYWIIR